MNDDNNAAAGLRDLADRITALCDDLGPRKDRGNLEHFVGWRFHNVLAEVQDAAAWVRERLGTDSGDRLARLADEVRRLASDDDDRPHDENGAALAPSPADECRRAGGELAHVLRMQAGAVDRRDAGETPAMPEAARFIDTTAAAARLGRSPRTVRDWCEKQRVPCHRAERQGNVWLIPEADIPAD